MRLGLSESMYSTAGEETEPMHTAHHRRAPRRPRVEAAEPNEDQDRQQLQPARKARGSLNAATIVLGVVLSAILVATSTAMLGPPLRTWQLGVAHIHAQFAHLERNVLMLGEDTERLETTAKGFLKSCQKVQVSALARTEMLASSVKQSFDEQVKTRVEDYGFVMKEALAYYAQQNQRIQETRDRLVSMNVSLPVQIVVRPLPLSLEDDDGHQFFARPEDNVHSIDEAPETPEGGGGFGSLDRFASAMEELTFFAEKSLQQDANDGYYQRLTVETIAIQAVSLTESSSQELSSSRSSNGSFFFYAFVACVSAGYLWNSITDMKSKTLVQKKGAWSPVPKMLGRLKAILKSIVIIEDLRAQQETGEADYNAQEDELAPESKSLTKYV